MRKLLSKKRYSVPLGLAAAWLLLGFLAVGPLVRWQLRDRLPALLHRPVTIAEVAFDPLRLALTVRGASVQDHDGSTLLSFDELMVNAAGTQLVRGIIGFDEIRLHRPLVSVNLLRHGQLSIADLLEPGPAAEKPASPPGPPSSLPRIRIARLSLTEGALAFTDGSRPTPYHAEVRPLAFELTDFSTEPGADSAYRFNASIGATQVRWDGDLVPSPLRSKGKFSIEGLELPALAPYLEGRTRLVLAAGKASLSAHYALEGSALALSDAVLGLTGLAVNAPHEKRTLVALQHLEVRARTIDLPSRTVALEAVTLDGGQLDLRTLPGGALELAELAGPGTPAPAAPPPPAPPAPSAPWHVTLTRLAVQHLGLSWNDRSLRAPALIPLTDVALEVTGLELPLSKPVQVALGARLEDGTLSVSGPVALDPLAATLAVRLEGLPLEPLWPYAAESTDADLTDGTATFAGEVALQGGAVKASGDLHLDGLRLEDPDGEALLVSDRLELAHLAVTTRPTTVELGTLSLARARLQVALDEHGDLAALKLLRPGPPAPKDPAPAGPPPTLRVGLLRLDDVRVDLLDRSVTPPGALSLQRLQVRVRNLTSPRRSVMPVDLTGKVDGAPLTVKGTVRPAGQDSLADLAITLGGYELPLATPYSVKYVAQPIQKGKLSLDLTWKVSDHRLAAQNRLRVDQLDFGDAVAQPGPDASHLPLGLAVAILSDRSGLIDLEVPMEGDLGDPQFGWLKVVGAALRNILEKVATAPFALLAGLVPGDPETLKTVTFVPGEAQPAPAEAAKLEALAGVLGARPGLKVEVTPQVAPELDRPALTRRQLRASLAARLDADGGSTGLDDGAWRRWVLETWRGLHPDAGAPDPATAEQAVLAARAVGDEQLEALKRERAELVQGSLTADGGVGPERIFLTLDADAVSTGQPLVTIDLKAK
jgi:Domain of Unknown Function (DUF748)